MVGSQCTETQLKGAPIAYRATGTTVGQWDTNNELPIPSAFETYAVRPALKSIYHQATQAFPYFFTVPRAIYNLNFR